MATSLLGASRFDVTELYVPAKPFRVSRMWLGRAAVLMSGRRPHYPSWGEKATKKRLESWQAGTSNAAVGFDTEPDEDLLFEINNIFLGDDWRRSYSETRTIETSSMQLKRLQDTPSMDRYTYKQKMYQLRFL